MDCLIKRNPVVRLLIGEMFAVVLSLSALAAQKPTTSAPQFRPLVVAGETAAELARYSLRAIFDRVPS